jgi:tetratricopeptide (TPR) repeat protein
VTANVKSFEVSVERANRKELPTDAHNFHALHWLEYGLLQQGRYPEAREKLEKMEKYGRASHSPRALWYYAAMRAGYGVETNKWDELPPSLGTTGVGLTGTAMDLFATGMGAAKTGNTKAAEEALGQLRQRIAEARETDVAGTDDYSITTQTDIETAAILARELAAQLLFDGGKVEEALMLLKEATTAEESLPFAFGPPTVVKPSHELLGEILLSLGRPAEAQEEFDKALQRPGRRHRGRTASLRRGSQQLAEYRRRTPRIARGQPPLFGRLLATSMTSRGESRSLRRLFHRETGR